MDDNIAFHFDKPGRRVNGHASDMTGIGGGRGRRIVRRERLQPEILSLRKLHRLGEPIRGPCNLIEADTHFADTLNVGVTTFQHDVVDACFE